MVGRKTKIGFLCLLMILLFSAFAFGYSVLIDGTTYHFEYKRTITIQGSEVPGAQSQFPMLFDSTTDPLDLQLDLRTQGYGGNVRNSNGDDIVFAVGDDQEIFKCEIEFYDDEFGDYIAWVRVDLTGSDQDIYLYYGCDQAIVFPLNFTTDVWSNNYVAVYHLKETTGGTDAIKDSTSSGLHGTDVNSPTLGANGQMHYAIDFDGSQSQYIDIDYYNLGNDLSYSMWFRRLGSGDQYIFSFMRTAICLRDDRITWWPNTSVGGENSLWTPNTNWYHLVINQWGSTNCNMYLNGSSIHSESAPAIDTASLNRDWIGRMPASYFTGPIDEVRISDGPRSSGWIFASHSNQYDPGGFYTVGDAGPTLVELSYFRATSLDSAVILEWKTETELDNAGFNIWRKEEKNGDYVRINPYFIPGEGEAGFGAEYSLTDYNVTNGVIYYYKLEEIDIYGKSIFHGPVPAVPHDIIPFLPNEGEKLHSGALLFSWASTGSYSYKVEISLSPSFSGSETLSFPDDGWIHGNSLWISLREREMVLRKAQESEGKLFWRVRARSEDGRVVFGKWRKLVLKERMALGNRQRN